MKKFEYKLEHDMGRKSLIETINKLGLDGWELVSISVDYDCEYNAWLKRELQ